MAQQLKTVPVPELTRLLDTAWHALDFLPEPSLFPVPGSIGDPKGDLRRALEALQDRLEELL